MQTKLLRMELNIVFLNPVIATVFVFIISALPAKIRKIKLIRFIFYIALIYGIIFLVINIISIFSNIIFKRN